jgi:hypothetical protein
VRDVPAGGGAPVAAARRENKTAAAARSGGRRRDRCCYSTAARPLLLVGGGAGGWGRGRTATEGRGGRRPVGRRKWPTEEHGPWARPTGDLEEALASAWRRRPLLLLAAARAPAGGSEGRWGCGRRMATGEAEGGRRWSLGPRGSRLLKMNEKKVGVGGLGCPRCNFARWNQLG